MMCRPSGTHDIACDVDIRDALYLFNIQLSVEVKSCCHDHAQEALNRDDYDVLDRDVLFVERIPLCDAAK